MTTTSPVSSPCEITAWASSKRRTSTLRTETVLAAGSTIHTAGRWFILVRAEDGISIIGPAFVLTRPMTVAPSRIAGGGSVRPTLTSKVRVTALA